ncbi:uncharacterized protein AMSG_03605 [Thecamonas trahens ATCC 50062]|uniref:rRNA-processing protein EBP2 n=1 Tax=Thecamonas trahens ATCC 50062 TaxID=461836 RepID=A0A0L0D489_THETB|nr:hypothetical protein AMSG_03605 [Thecamonas trahens ATCC 50062]KNC47177.1 hypothetical protein AMSG_03605 [Thecamonas trahens ATCC 50062]|eukprot:XP_013759951.1 hypothetical protein AMSG_03605 [Thecamonas trahens ATCC 50062]
MSESDHSEVEFECESSSSSSFDIDKQRFLEEVANAPVEALAPRKPSYTNEEEVMEDKRKEIMLPKEWPWIETLDVTSAVAAEELIGDVENDFAREQMFYNQALAAALQARNYFAEHSIPANRPHDYFAETIKTDAHMERVRKHHVQQDLRIAAVEKRKREKVMKKFGKRVEAEKIQERALKKRAQAEVIKTWRKRRANALDDNDDVEFDLQLLDEAADAVAARAAKKPKLGPNGRPMANAKRRHKNEKYGFGGRQKHAKSNTKDSVDDFASDFSSRSKGKMMRGMPQRLSRGAKPAGKKKPSKRQGKRSRKNRR